MYLYINKFTFIKAFYVNFIFFLKIFLHQNWHFELTQMYYFLY